IADLIFCRRVTSVSSWSARRRSTESSVPAVSPALIMATYSREKVRVCLAMEVDRAVPFSTSARISPTMRASSLSSVCSSRIERARRSGSPEFTMVANWRENPARFLSLTFPLRTRISVFIPTPRFCFTSRGTYPISRSLARTRSWFSADISPLTREPWRSRTLYAYVLGTSHPHVRSAQELVQVLDVVTLFGRRLVRDLRRLDQGGQGLVHGLHPEPRPGLHRGVDLVDLGLPDEVAHGRRGDEDLTRHHPAEAVRGRQQLLRRHPLQGRGQLHSDLLLLVRREHVDDTVDRLRRVLRVQRGEDQVAGFGRGQRRGDGFQVPHLTDEDDVGVLAQDVLQRAGERVRVLAHLALVDHGALVVMQELDGILDRHDVDVVLAVHDVHQRRQGRRLPGACRPGHQHEASRQPGEVAHLPRERQLLQGLDLERDEPERGAQGVSLEVHVHPEPALARQRVGRVELQLLLQPLPLALGEDRIQHPLDLVGPHLRVLIEPDQPAIDPHHRRASRRDVEVAGVAVEDRLEQLTHRDVYDFLLYLSAH